MKFLGLEISRSKKPAASIPLNDLSGYGLPSVSGAYVTENRVMGLTAHFACVRLIATTLASLPIHIYERTETGKKKRNNHPAARLLREAPNSEMTAYSFIEALQAQLSNRGKAFAEIVHDRKGNIEALLPIPVNSVQPRRKDKFSPVEYHFTETGTILPAWKILHIPGLGFDGINSFSPIQLFRQTFGLGMAVEEFGARFFSNGTNIGGILEHPGKLSDEAIERLKTSTKVQYEGLRRSHGLMVLEEGMKYTKIAMPLEDIQFIESRKFTATEIARIHGVPPHLIGDLEKATFSNIEEQGLEAVIYLFRSWAVRWEQAFNNKLFSENERGKYYIKFELDGLLRGNMKDRYTAYATGMQNGFLNADEVREKEDMNPLPNGAGQIYRFPLNMSQNEKKIKSQGEVT